MKPRFSALVLVGLLVALSLPVLPLNWVAAQDDQRGMRVQQGERRVALVIGNSAYKDSPLLNPVNDARAMAQALRGFGFEVVYGEDLSRNDMERNIRLFGSKIRDGAVGLFYYAGHGIQINGANYLIPVGANIIIEEEVKYESVDVGLVLAQMENARNTLNIVILDACRNNPFARSFRSTQKGLASIDAPSGTLIAYATAPGSVASDGAGKNGLYTQELLKQMRAPRLNIEQVFKQVRVAVRDLTQGKQVPWESSSLVGDFYFSEPTLPTGRPSSEVSAAAIELSFWESIKSSTDPDDYKEYLAKYPSGTFAGLARNKIRSLEEAAKPTGGAVEPKSNEAALLKPNSSGTLSPSPMPPLRGFEFDTVMVDSKGSITSRRKGHARYFTEVINGVGLEMVEIPGGTFLMGTSEIEARQVASEYKRSLSDKKLAEQWAGSERPQHTVTVPTFYMGKYEVTQAQWRAVVSLPKVKMDLKLSPSVAKDDTLPVELVSWEEAVEFCERLSRATRRQYRLPTEAEWEYACRAGAITQFAFGDTITTRLENYDGNHPYGAAPKGIFSKQPNPVGGSGIANGFGLFDMHGNVGEWCLDTWHENYNGAPSDGRVWEGGDMRYRVLRGGSWGSHAGFCRAAYRSSAAPVAASNLDGFRVALSATTR